MEATQPQVLPQDGPVPVLKGKHGGYRGVPRDPKTGRLMPKEPRAEAAEPETIRIDDDPEQLEDMVFVLSRPAARGESYHQKELRKWLSDDRKGFMQAKTRLEEAAAKAPRGKNSSALEQDPVEDVGERVCLELLDRFLEGGDEAGPVDEVVDGPDVREPVESGEPVSAGGAAGLAG